MAASVVLGARLLGADPQTVEAWVADRDLVVGDRLDVDDLRAVRIDAGGALADGYLLRRDDLPPDSVLTRPVARGELLPRAALGAEEAGLVEVALWAPAVAIPPGVRAGAVVDVWLVRPEDGRARLALDDVTVVAVPAAEADYGPGGDRQVVVAVPADAAETVGDVLAAAHAGTVSITRRR